MEKILNLKQLNEIFEGDPGPIQEILMLLDETIPEFLEKIYFCMEENNFDLLKVAIHKFKSSCQLVTDSTFIELIRSIEKTDNPTTTAVKQDIGQLVHLTKLLHKEVQATRQAAQAQ